MSRSLYERAIISILDPDNRGPDNRGPDNRGSTVSSEQCSLLEHNSYTIQQSRLESRADFSVTLLKQSKAAQRQGSNKDKSAPRS